MVPTYKGSTVSWCLSVMVLPFCPMQTSGCSGSRAQSSALLQLQQSEGRGRGASPNLILLLIWYWVLVSDRAGEEGLVVSQIEAPGAVTPRSLAWVTLSLLA